MKTETEGTKMNSRGNTAVKWPGWDLKPYKMPLPGHWWQYYLLQRKKYVSMQNFGLRKNIV